MWCVYLNVYDTVCNVEAQGWCVCIYLCVCKCIMCACVCFCVMHAYECVGTPAPMHTCWSTQAGARDPASPPTVLHLTFRDSLLVNTETLVLVSVTSQFSRRIIWPCFLGTGITRDYHACPVFVKGFWEFKHKSSGSWPSLYLLIRCWLHHQSPSLHIPSEHPPPPQLKTFLLSWSNKPWEAGNHLCPVYPVYHWAVEVKARFNDGQTKQQMKVYSYH